MMRFIESKKVAAAKPCPCFNKLFPILPPW